MPKTAPPLSPRLEAAFARLDGATPAPSWPRSVRLGTDYALRASGMDPQTDAEADSLAYTCFVLGNLAKRDPPGDPPATVTAHDEANTAGPLNGQAFELLGQIRDGSAAWSRHGWAVPTLAPDTIQLLQKAARGEPVTDLGELLQVLEAAEHVARRLGMRLLTEGARSSPAE
jgi:hypothetical protein